MKQQIEYRISKINKRWIAKEINTNKKIASSDTKNAAIDYAINTARRHRPSCVKIYSEEGYCYDEYVFGLKSMPWEGDTKKTKH